MLSSWRRELRRRVRAWARRRVGEDVEPLVLVQRRLYILPTRQGMVFGLILFAMLLGAMNYSNSLAFGLTFMLTGLGFVAMHHAHRNLLALRVRLGRAEPVFAGGEALFRIELDNPTPTDRLDVRVEYEDEVHDITDVPAESGAELCFRVPAPKRGLLRVEAFGLSTIYPFGLFRAWTWVYLNPQCIVYPRPSGRRMLPAPVPVRESGRQDLSAGDDDFAGLRGYRHGDAPKHIHWKAYAREQGLQVKLFSGQGVSTRWFDFDHMPAEMGVEERLSQLCRWIVDAEAEGRSYGLRLPGTAIPPGNGRAHRRHCLTALARFEPDGGGREVGDARTAA